VPFIAGPGGDEDAGWQQRGPQAHRRIMVVISIAKEVVIASGHSRWFTGGEVHPMRVLECVPAGILAAAFVAAAAATGSSGAEREHQITAAAPAEAARDGQRDFDFEFGTWKVRLRRLLKPLSGSNEWVEMAGTSTVRKVWDGRANLGEIAVADASSRLEGLSLRLYDPATRQWSIYWANARDGALGEAMVGRFANGRGEFYNQELFDGRAIFVRFIFSDITSASFRLEQAFSADGGRTWEPNWIATFTR
jgi:hypothetical protein